MLQNNEQWLADRIHHLGTSGAVGGSVKTTVQALSLLLRLVDQAFDVKAWHGPNLRGSLRRVSAKQAAWRPASGRHSIAEIAVHCAYWKYAARRRFRDDKRGSFPLRGNNWFRVPDLLDEQTWTGYRALLDEQHRHFRDAVAELSPEQIHVVPRGSQTSNLALIQGIAAHDLYHAGQIQLLKRLSQG